MNQPFKLTDKQSQLVKLAGGKAKHILAYGGSRSGKTFGFCYCIGVRAISAPNSRHLIARKHNIEARQAVMMDTWPKMMAERFPDVPYTPNKTDQFVTFSNGAEVWFGGLDDKERVEKILGKEYATIYPNETSQISYEAILMLRTRLAQTAYKSNGDELERKAYYDLNPVGKSHWTYKEWIEGVVPTSLKPLPKSSRAWININPGDNPNLPDDYIQDLENLPELQRKRFLSGEYLSEVPGTLWPIARIDAARVDTCPDLKRIVVAVDPSGSDGTGGDSQGIIVAGEGVDGHCYILEDATCNLSPAGWGHRVVQKYHDYSADLVIIEKNYGGAMVVDTIATVDKTVNVKTVHANAGQSKQVRAEPVAALYEPRESVPARVHHVGRFPDLEDQMTMFTTDGYQGSGSPDRADALVWGVRELMLGNRPASPLFGTYGTR